MCLCKVGSEGGCVLLFVKGHHRGRQFVPGCGGGRI